MKYYILTIRYLAKSAYRKNWPLRVFIFFKRYHARLALAYIARTGEYI